LPEELTMPGTERRTTMGTGAHLVVHPHEVVVPVWRSSAICDHGRRSGDLARRLDRILQIQNRLDEVLLLLWRQVGHTHAALHRRVVGSPRASGGTACDRANGSSSAATTPVRARQASSAADRSHTTGGSGTRVCRSNGEMRNAKRRPPVRCCGGS